MKDHKIEFLLALFIELRKELVESQKIRAQILGFKITFVATAVGLIMSNLNSFDPALLVIPSFAAICFDFIIYSYSFSIKRIGMYCREYIEPNLKQELVLSNNFVLWQSYLKDPKTRQNLATIGNLGFTLLVVILGLIGLYLNGHKKLLWGLSIVLVLFFILDVILAIASPRQLGDIWEKIPNKKDKN